jgi:hypothetical protein
MPSTPTPQEMAQSITLEVLLQAYFAKISDYQDTLFDFEGKHPGEKEDLAKNIAFLRALPLSDMEFEGTERDDFFQIKNKKTGETINVSNRGSSRAELRSQLLRDYLTKAKEENSSQTAYDVLVKILDNPLKTDAFLVARTLIPTDDPKRLVKKAPTPAMPTTQFPLFSRLLVDKIQDTVEAQGIKRAQYTSNDIMHDKGGLGTKLKESIDTESLYKVTKVFSPLIERLAGKDPKKVDEVIDQLFPLVKQFAALDKKIKQFEQQGYAKAAESTKTLKRKLEDHINSLVSGELSSIANFKAQCSATINEASAELGKHRGMRGILANIGNALITIFSLGMVSNVFETRTASAVLIDKFKTRLDELAIKDPGPRDAVVKEPESEDAEMEDVSGDDEDVEMEDVSGDDEDVEMEDVSGDDEDVEMEDASDEGDEETGPHP